MKLFFVVSFFFFCFGQNLFAQAAEEKTEDVFWKISDDTSIVWDITKEDRLPHSDNIEMAGKKVAAIIDYAIDKDKSLTLSRDVIFPQLRTYNKSNEPDWKKYRAYFRREVGSEINPSIQMGEKIIVPSQIDSIKINGMLTFYATPVDGIQVIRTLYPSPEQRFVVERWTIQNISTKPVSLSISNSRLTQTETGYKGSYTFEAFSDSKNKIELKSGTSYEFPVYYGATLNSESSSNFDAEKAWNQRAGFLESMKDNLVLETENDVLNTLFYFSKIRASESIFDSSMGLVHSPGGGNYYVGIWANDQVEYSGPFFPYLGYEVGNTAAFNTYQKFLENIPKEDTHIPYAFEVDGIFAMDHLDRGDAAMIAYGTSHYALSIGNMDIAKKLWPLISWCLNYCHNHRNEDGAVLSESDEMEGRIETGDANLSTSTLYYGGLKYASILAEELYLKKLASTYQTRLDEMDEVIENYFGANLEGLETYRYFEGNTYLRHWICLPMTMGITKRQEDTAKALFEKLWTNNGILVELNPQKEKENMVFWDRATLYALRGALKTDGFDTGISKLIDFSKKRLLGNHVPYVIEAFPENNMRHLSAESALYCRIFTEGLLGIEPMGFQSVKITPKLPDGWNTLTLRKVFLSGTPVDLFLARKKGKIELKIVRNGKTVLTRKVSPKESVIYHLK